QGTPAGRVLQSNPGARFGRNIPLNRAWPNNDLLLTPNPRLISERLLQRDKFKEAKILNLLAAAWIQFEVHDWFFHGEPTPTDPFHLPLEPNDTWRQHAPEMVIRRTQPDPTRDYALEDDQARKNPRSDRYPPTYVNTGAHWWDASQIYGGD